jgi:hypothetical protein
MKTLCIQITTLILLPMFIFNCGISESMAPKHIGTINAVIKGTPGQSETSKARMIGEHCRFQNLYSAPHPDLNMALQEALNRAPKGTTGFKNATVSYRLEMGYTAFLFSLILIPPLYLLYYFAGGPNLKHCYVIEGTPAK